MGNGDAAEREVINRLEDEMGWRTLRAPASGGGTDRERPDAIAGKDGTTIVFEVKKSSGDPIYIDHEEIAALQAYGEDFGAEVRLAIRWRSNSIRDTTVYCPRPEQLHETEKYRRVKYEDCEEGQFETLESLCTQSS